MATNFVKFQRGSQEAYGILRDRNRVDPDTLYFLYDSQDPDAGGDLYLGYTLIGGTSSSGSSVSSLRELTDVSLVGSLQDGMILQYSVTRNKWVNKTLAKALEDAAISFGETSVTVEAALAEGETVNDVLTEIVDPNEGDIAVIAGNPYVYDGTTWVSLTNSNVLSRISNIESQIATLNSTIQTIRGEIDTKIANANHLRYRKLNAGETLNDIDTTASDIAQTVFLVPNSSNENDNQYYEYMYIDNHFEKIGSWEANLSGYVTSTQLNTAVTNLQNQLNNLPNIYVTTTRYNQEVGDIAALATKVGKQSTTVIAEISDIYDRLTWQAISTT